MHERKGGMEEETQTSKVTENNQWEEGGAKGGIVGGLKFFGFLNIS